MNNRVTQYDLNLSQEMTAKIDKLLKNNRRNYLEYPWDGLEGILKEQNDNIFRIVGYGSLINANSAAHTVSVQDRKPVLAFGVYRKFNYVIPKDNTRYGVTKNALHRAALNIEVTDKVDDFINGLLIEIPISDVDALRKREIAYDLVHVPCIWWDDMDSDPFLAYMLYCPYEVYKGIEKTDNSIEPHINYYKVCRDGAYSFGPEFLDCWKATSFLADGTTSVNIWETKNNISP
jgi:cation transport regulator ChaC